MDLFNRDDQQHDTPDGGAWHVKGTDYSDEWLTPPEILHPLGEFDLDPAAPVKRPWPTANRHYDVMIDGLKNPWRGRVFLNPPYSNIEPFMEKMSAHDHGTALVFARTGAQWFQNYVFGAASGLLFIKGRLNFYRPTGLQASHNAGADSVLVSYGQYDQIRLKHSTLKGQYVAL